MYRKHSHDPIFNISEPDVQKILAFEGAFEELFEIITREGGIEGDVIVIDVLRCAHGLLRFNSLNQVGPIHPFTRRVLGLL